MKLPIFQVDAFTSHAFGGNPAAVVLLDAWLPDDVMQSIAAENNLAETAFIVAPESAADPIPLRWFTPAIEVDLCGHATLAAGHVLFRHRDPLVDTLHFSTSSGILSVTRRGGLFELDLPARPGKPTEVTDALVAALGARPSETLAARDLLAVFASAADVRALKPDFVAVAALDTFAVIATAPGDEADVDFVSRFFAPRAGVNEDPVTGSAHCTLVPYWAARLGRHRLVARQVSRRGGELTCELRGSRVGVAGRAVEYLSGTIDVPSPHTGERP